MRRPRSHATLHLVTRMLVWANVADMSDVLASMAEASTRYTPALAACLRPYTREHIRRFGQMCWI